jgi:hypothetical protein
MSHLRQYIQVLVHSDPTDVGLNRHRQGLPPWNSEFHIRPLILLPIQYSPFSLNCPAESHIKLSYQLIKFSTFQREPGYKRPKISQVEPATRLLLKFYLRGMALLMDFPP